MRIVLVMSEASLWKPKFVAGLITKLPPEQQVVGMVLTSFQPRKVSRLKHYQRYLTMLGLPLFFYIAIRESFHGVLDLIDRYFELPTYHSIAGVCRRNDIPIFYTKDVNAEDCIHWIENHEPDVLVSSGNQIFRKRLLEVPKKASINRHTSLLPAYGGIYPIFWCLLHDEEEVGVSVHTMTEKIDEGFVLSQQALKVSRKDTFFSLFEACFELSVDVVADAIAKIASNDMKPISNGLEKSYYSYPTAEEVKKFRSLGKRMI